MILPAILLQKPSRNSKAKEHTLRLEQRLNLWKQGDLYLIMKECQEIQRRMKISQRKYDGDKTAKIFARLILQGKINAALRYLNENGNVGVLNLSPEVLLELKEKHPPPSKIQPYSLLFGPIDLVPNSVFDSIDETMIYKVAMVTKGAGGPSNFDAEQHRRILCSKNFSAVGKDLREQIAP